MVFISVYITLNHLDKINFDSYTVRQFYFLISNDCELFLKSCSYIKAFDSILVFNVLRLTLK